MKNKKVLVTGGAGYIGSHTIIELISAGYEVVSVDDFSNSTPSTFSDIKKITGVAIKNYNVDLSDYKKLTTVLKKEKDVFAVIHFAARKSVPESVANPLLYYSNNIGSTVNILKWCKENNVNKFVFSSSCSVYGENSTSEVTENTPLGKPFSAYAATKQMGEKILEDVSTQNKKMKSIALRYFNPAGAHESGLIGVSLAQKSQNIVPIIIEIISGEKKGPLKILGNTYATRDGSCVRDYVHVTDIARAHVCALVALHKTKLSFDVVNVGAGKGVTVLELVEAFERVLHTKIQYVIAPPREGDVPEVYANNTKAVEFLKWKPILSLEKIIETSWRRQENLNK